MDKRRKLDNTVKETRGGKREGSGRPKKEKTVVISFRVKAKDVDKIKKTIKRLCGS